MKIQLLLLLAINLLLSQSKQDTIRFYPLFKLNINSNILEFNQERIERIDYKFFTDIFSSTLALFSNELGENGKPANLNFNFFDMRLSHFFLNGRTLTGYIYPYQFLHILPLDNIYKIEIIHDFSAPIFQNSNASATNFVFKNIFNMQPITRIRYVEDAYDFIATDGSFSYNFYRNLNLTIGFRRSTSSGRFLNSGHDAWNLFVNSLWEPMKNLKFSFLNIYTIINDGLNGGIDTAKAPPNAENIIYNERIAPVVDINSSLSSKRNDLTILSTYQIDSIGSIDFTIYHTFQIDNLSVRREANKRNSNFYGLKLNFKTSFLSADLNGGVEIQKNNLKLYLSNDTLLHRYVSSGSKSILSLSAFLNSNIKIHTFKLFPFLRIENLYDRTISNYGLGIEGRFGNLKLYSGFSHSQRVLTLFEQFITNSSDFEKHQVYETGLRFEIKSFLIDLKIQNRKIQDFLVFRDSSFYRAYISKTFGELGIKYKLWRVNFSLKSSLILNKVSKPYPRYIFNAEAFYEGKLTRTLDLIAGVRAKALDEFNAFRFINSALLFVESSYEIRKVITADLFISGRIKNVVIFLTLANITNEKYMTTAFYPMQDRSLRFGVIWTFFD
ncbi:MAG: putative porin [Candidatus Kryptonium sp.]